MANGAFRTNDSIIALGTVTPASSISSAATGLATYMLRYQVIGSAYTYVRLSQSLAEDRISNSLVKSKV